MKNFKFFPKNEPGLVLNLFLIFGKNPASCSYKLCSYKKKTCTNSNFLDAISHFFKRVFPSVRPSVRRSVRLSVGRSHMSWISNKWAEFEQHSIRNMRICHKKDDSKTSTRAVRQNASVVQTLFDLLADMLLNFLIMIFLQVETWEFCCSGN